MVNVTIYSIHGSYGYVGCLNWALKVGPILRGLELSGENHTFDTKNLHDLPIGLPKILVEQLRFRVIEHSHGKSPFLIGKPSINGPLNMIDPCSLVLARPLLTAWCSVESIHLGARAS